MISTTSKIEQEGLEGITVAAFESRMAREMEDLITRSGGLPRVAPSMREVPLEKNKHIFEFFDRLKEGEFNLVILMTGVGTKKIFQVLETQYPPSHIQKAFKQTALLVRGPKSLKVITDYHLRAAMTAPEPNTWREVLNTIIEHQSLENQRIAVQEYGVSNPELLQALQEGGAKEVISLPIYRWALPEDTTPLIRLIESILRGEIQVGLFTSGQQIQNVLEVAQSIRQEGPLKRALARMVLGSIGPVASEALKAAGIPPDFEPEHPKMGFLVKEAAKRCRGLMAQKAEVHLHPSPLEAKTLSQTPFENLFLKACRKEPVSRTPLWIMRQAGRYLPEYREIRSMVPFLDLCKTPELAAEITVRAQEVLEVDAAILFADILLISEPMGFQLEFVENGGPVIRNPFRSPSDLNRLKEIHAREDLGYVLQTIRQIKLHLKPYIPLIGFAGAPFTLASYLIEGGGTRDYLHTRAVMNDIKVWDELMKRLVTATVSYLNAQIEAGVHAVQLFDSWVGILTPDEFQRLVLPYLKLLVGALDPSIPLIYFGTQTAPFYPWLKDIGAQVVGVDWRMDLDRAWKLLGDVAIQGNLNPQILLTDPATVITETEKILRLAAGRPGHIFNLGHGILPQTPMENVRAMVDTVKGWKT